MSSITTLHVPPVIESRLAQVRQRIALIRLLEVLVATGIVLLLSMMAAMAIDALLVLFEPRWRVILTVSALGTTAATLLVGCIRSTLIGQTLSAVALAVDRAVPPLQERWSTITELANSVDPPEMRGGEQLIGRVAREAADLSGLVDARRIVGLDRLRGRGYVLAAAIGLLAVVFICAPRHASILLRRFWAPTRDISFTQLTSTGDRVIAMGEPVTLEARGEGGFQAEASLFIRNPDGQRHSDIPTAHETAMLFKYHIDAPHESFDYRFRAGDGQTSWNRLTVVDRPSIAQVHFELTPPAYSKLPVQAKDALPRQSRTLKGSRLQVAIRPTKPLAHMELRCEGGRVESLQASADQWYRFETQLDENIMFTPWLADEFGLTNLSPPSCRVTVYVDQPPSVQIISPADQITVQPDDKIQIEFKAQDDIGVASAELVVTSGQGKDEKTVQVTPIPLGKQQDAKSVQGKVELDIKPLALKDGAQLNYTIRVSDTRQASALAQVASEVSKDKTTKSAEAKSGTSQPSSRDPKGSASNANATQPSDTTKNEQAASTQPAGDAKNKQAAATQPSNGSGQSNSTPSKSPTSKPAEQSSSPPPVNMTTRRLLNEEPKASSQKQRLIVDKWAGSFEGQARRKLQIAIDEYLKRLDASLAAAQTETAQLRELARTNPKRDEQQLRGLAKSREQLTQADATIAELRAKSKDTPYAFIGLQLHDIGTAHVNPARALLTTATTRPETDAALVKDYADAWYHITRARELLADLTKKYEEVKREHNLAEAAEHVAKMHRIILEDTYALLKACRPTLNPRKNKMIEVPEGFAEQLKAYLEEIKKLNAELAKVLSEDPVLLRRFMAMQRQENMTLRDQLTVLAQRESRLHQHVTVASTQPATASTAPAVATTQPADQLASVPKDVIADLTREQLELAASIAHMHDDMVAWMPRQAGTAKDALAKAESIAAEAARLAHDAAASLASAQSAPSIIAASQVAAQLNAIHAAIFGANAQSEPDSELSYFVANRMSDVERLMAGEFALSQKIQALSQNRPGTAMSVDQNQIRQDTLELGGKLNRNLGKVLPISRDAFDKLKQVIMTMNDEIVVEQVEAGIALKVRRWPLAAGHTGKAVAGYAKSEKLFDEALTLIEKAIAAHPAPPMVPQPPGIEQILAMLEKEGKALDKLGAAGLRLNIMIQGDWEGSGDGAGSGKGSGHGSGRSQKADANQSNSPGDPDEKDEQADKGQSDRQLTEAEAARRTAEAQARAARELAEKTEEEAKKSREGGNDTSKRTARRNDPRKGPGGSTAGEGTESKAVAAEGRDFNTFVSKLEEELNQGRGTIPPQQYREAIDAYFRTLAEQVSKNKAP